MESLWKKINMDGWNYNKDTDVYWQTGIAYCENPADAKYENLGIYVPGAYMSGTENGNGTYHCKINTTGSVGAYTAKTAPIAIPVETPGYSAMDAPTGYAGRTSAYTDAGFVCVYAGCRGREAGAPSGVTDLKAAIRYIRYNGETIPGSTERIFSFGMSGGGAQSALLGATGDSDLYTPYLKAIGAVDGVSDAVAGSMCWCPITSLDYASEAYEWNLGSSRTGLTEEMQALSDGMAEQFALYINRLGLKDKNGNVLTLTASDRGIYQAGSYYDYLKTVIETSLSNFLEDTAKTAQDYINTLNTETEWVKYDSTANSVSITCIADFVSRFKTAFKGLGAFDALDKTQLENILFGDGDGTGDHFDAVMAELLADSDYGTEYAEGLKRTDALGSSVSDRVNMYNPLYYLSDYYGGYKTANVAPYWRIRTGINQGDTALTTEVNLALALQHYGVNVDFETVWGQPHVEAERVGSSTDNFIAWVNEVCGVNSDEG